MIDINAIAEQAELDVFEQAPRSLMAVSSQTDFQYALSETDRRYVPTQEARGEHFARGFFRGVGWDPASKSFNPPSHGKHVLFFGHVGCGKSTELKRMSRELAGPARYWVVQVDLLDLIDIHNAHYPDIWLAVAQKLVERAEEDGISVKSVILDGMKNWFTERVLVQETLREFRGEVEARVEAKVGLPWLAEVLGRITTAFKIGTSYRESLRTVVKNSYSDFISSLNQLVLTIRDGVRDVGKGREILFVIDGPDRFQGDDWRRFFVEDVNQLVMVRCTAIYAAPMALKSCGARLDLFLSLWLPMVKLYEFSEEKIRRDVGFDALRKIILKRCHYSLFDSVDVLDRLIEYSGGHLRDLLRLLFFACVETNGSILDRESVEAAAKRLAADYRDWLRTDHYPVLAAADRDPENAGSDDIVTRLVEGGALLEYNSGTWRQPHPVVRLLTGFQRALRAAATSS